MTAPCPSFAVAASVNVSLAEDQLTEQQMPKSSVKHSNNRRTRRRVSLDYRTNFKDRWQAFMRGEFEGPAEIAFEFGCDYGTAEGWEEGRNGPSGPFVGFAYARWPEKAAAYLRGSDA